MAYLYLAAAIVAEVIATSALKASNAFTVLTPGAISVVGYCVSFYLLALVLRTIPVGIAYAIWCGIGIVAVNIIAIFLFNQIPDLAAIIGMALIIVGTAVINLFSNTVTV
ncbi:MAG: multidrug efflux SMR transporter [Gammaproteobacteria bacterium]|jgi:small multidrug resistance pump